MGEKAGGIDHLLREGIAAAKAGEKERARDLLLRVVEQDERNSMAWLWLSGVVESLEDQEVCLENVLTVDPDNAAARRGLKYVRSQMKQQSPPPPPPAPSPSPVEERAQTPVSPAAAILKESYAQRQPPPPEPEPALPTSSPWDDLEDETLCPYCAAPTEYEDKKCPACGQSLWLKFRRREKRSSLLWLTIAFQLFGTMQLALIPLLALVYAGMRTRSLDPQALDPFEMLNAYLGLGTVLSPEAVQAAFDVVPRSLFFLSLLPFTLSAIVLVGLYLRWRPVYYLFLFNALWELAGAIAWMVLAGNIISGIVGIATALIGVVLIFQLEEDFAWDRRRILLHVDPDMTSGNELLMRGEKYAKQRMWALAAAYLHRAAGWLPEGLGSRLALAIACIRLERYDLADLALEEARQIQPGDPRVQEIEAVLSDLRSQA